MAIELAAILAVPAAIRELLDLAQRITKSTAPGPDDTNHGEKAIEVVHSIAKSIDEFALASLDSAAWKEVHHITNRIQTDLIDTFGWVSAGRREDFIQDYDRSRRRTIGAELQSARRRGASVLSLEIFATKGEGFSENSDTGRAS